MPVRSDRLAGVVTCPPGTSTTIMFTVPAGETWLVKRAVLYNPSGLATQVGAWGFADPGGGIGALWVAALAPTTADDRDVWWALDPGCVLFVNNNLGATGNLLASCFGAKLIGVA